MRSRSLAAYEQGDRDAVATLRAFEETEPLSVRTLFWAERSRIPRARESAHTDWVVFLIRHGVLHDEIRWRSRLAEAYGAAVVPRWANDIASALRTSSRGRCADVKGFWLTVEQVEVVRLVSRAVRAAQRAPAFRIALAAKCGELRALNAKGYVETQGDVLAPLGRMVLAWLRDRDWSDARPGAIFRSLA